jgi:hypothetical protein
LTFIETTEAGGLNRGDVDEHILAAILRHDESITLCGVKPLDCTGSHNCVLLRPRTVQNHTMSKTIGSLDLLRHPKTEAQQGKPKYDCTA